MKTPDILSRSGISLERLRVFLQIADAGSMAEAAPGDPVRQSQFSRQLRELEGAMGAPLTERQGRRVRLNENGRRLANVLRNFANDLGALEANLTGQPLSFQLGAGMSVLDFLIAPRLAGLLKSLRAARLDLLPYRTAEAMAALDEGRLDLAVVRADAVSERHPSVSLGRLDYQLFVPKRFGTVPAGKPGQITAWLANLPLAMVAGEGRLRGALDAAFARAGVKPNIISETGSLLQAASLVRAGHASAILPSLMAGGMDGRVVGVAALELLKPVQRPLVLTWNQRSMERVGCDRRRMRAVAAALVIRP